MRIVRIRSLDVKSTEEDVDAMIAKRKNILNFKVVEQSEDKLKKGHTKEGREKMVVKIPDPI